MDPAARLRREALRLYDRYALEIVEALRICPWAEQARRQGHVQRHVVLQADPDPEVLAAEVEALAAHPHVDIALLICPRVSGPRSRFEEWVARLREMHAARHAGAPPMAMAAFHPEALPDPSNGERLVPFLRRTPDPTVQLVRQSRLDEVRQARDRGTTLVHIDDLDLSAWLARPQPLHRRIAESNLQTVLALGIEEMQRRLDAIRADRDRSYRALGMP